MSTTSTGTTSTAASSRLVVLLFTDIVGSTDLKTRVGATAYAAMLDRHNAIFESISQELRGQILKHTGDGFFAGFPTASDAVRAALRFQHAMRTEPWPTPLAARVGIHVGEVVDVQMAGRSDVIGVAADVAAQVMSLADGGQILLTRSAFNDARQFVSEHPTVNGQQPSPALRWVAHGPYLIKGIDDPIEVFEVGADGVAPLHPPPGGGKAKRVVPHDQEPTLGWRPAVGLSIPQRPGWSLEKRLGEGGFGEVWLGHHAKTKQHRVFKFCFDADRLRSFKRELTLFRLLREALGERNDIARLYEVKLDEPPFFLESEWTEGGNLVDWSESRGGIATVPLEQRIEIVAKVADAVAAAHSIGILHKDIKPSNVLVQELPGKTIQPRLADFGIGFLADRSQLAARHITETGFTVITQTSGSSMTGTRLYAPPEVIAGKPFTTQGDIYALGVLLYQMAVGDLSRPLAEGWERDVPDELIRQDVAACCDGDPNRRPGGAGEIAQRIRALPQRRAELLDKAQHAQSVEKRQRLLRRSVGASVLMGVLVVAIASSSAFYIRRVRAAQQAETEQRRRAEDAEKAARESAAAAQAQADHAVRLAAYYNAQYLLGRSLVKEAWDKALVANVPPARWEDGHLLQQIVTAARGSWEVIGQIDDASMLLEAGPGMGCFVRSGTDQWVLLIPRGRLVELYSVPQCAHLGTIRCGTLAGVMCQAAANGQALISSGRTLMLWDVVAIKQLATVQEQDVITQISARPDVPTIATLDQAGHVAAWASADLKELARYQIEIHPRTSGQSAPTIDLSPSGNRIVAQTGVWRDGVVVWDWASNQTTPHALTSHQTVFLDDQTLLGYWNWGYGLDQAEIVSLSLDRPDAKPQYMTMRNLQDKTSAQIEFYRNPRGQRVAIRSTEALDVRGFPDGEMIISNLFSSLLPLTPASRVAAVAQDIGNGLLALKGDQLVVLRGPLRKSDRTMDGWSMSVCDRGMFTCELMEDEAFHPRGSLTLTPFSGAAEQKFRLEWPTPERKKVLPWGIWSPPNGSFVAVLRQETEPQGGGSVGSQYFGKSIAIYDTAGWRAAPDTWKIKTQFPLPQFDGIDARNDRWLCVTPDAKVALFCTYAVRGTRYSVPDGKLLGEINLGRWATPSPDGRLVVGGGNGNQPAKVWDIASGSVVFTTPDVGYARKACFTSDGKQLCVGWASTSSVPARIVWYDLGTGQRTRTLRTSLLPVAVPASGDRFAAFIQDTPATGKLVLASITDAEVTDMLNQGAHIQNMAWFDPSGRRLALVTFRDEAQVAAALTLDEARAALDPRAKVRAETAAQGGATPTTAPTVIADMPQVVASTTRPGLVRWQDAGAFVGKQVTVEALIIRTRNIGSRCFLNVTANRDASFLIVLNPSTFDKWPDAPENYFAGKKVSVSGTIELYRGAPEIVVDDPKQIEVLQAE